MRHDRHADRQRHTEALFNWNLALYLTADLRAEGATVVLTRTTNTGVGPCITQRADIGNDTHANAAVSIHADGGPPGGRGFAILEPVADGINNAIIGGGDHRAQGPGVQLQAHKPKIIARPGGPRPAHPDLDADRALQSICPGDTGFGTFRPAPGGMLAATVNGALESMVRAPGRTTAGMTARRPYSRAVGGSSTPGPVGVGPGPLVPG